MANHKSAQKRNRQNIKRRERNMHYKSIVRNQIKDLRSAIEEGNSAAAGELLSKTIRQIDRVASKGILPKRRASRMTSRLTKAVNNI